MLLNKKKTSEIYGLRSKLRLKWGGLKKERAKSRGQKTSCGKLK